jgi:membrane protease subunit HflC
MQSYQQTFQNGEGSSNIILSPQNAYLEKFRNGR